MLTVQRIPKLCIVYLLWPHHEGLLITIFIMSFYHSIGWLSMQCLLACLGWGGWMAGGNICLLPLLWGTLVWVLRLF